MSEETLTQLAQIIRARKSESAGNSYTRQLLDSGPQGCARKLGEEAIEVIIAGLGKNDAALTQEAADLLYHLLVLLEARGIAWTDVLEVLEDRMGRSGLEEKTARAPD